MNGHRADRSTPPWNSQDAQFFTSPSTPIPRALRLQHHDEQGQLRLMVLPLGAFGGKELNDDFPWASPTAAAQALES
jgi:hypothetical protein